MQNLNKIQKINWKKLCLKKKKRKLIANNLNLNPNIWMNFNKEIYSKTSSKERYQMVQNCQTSDKNFKLQNKLSKMMLLNLKKETRSKIRTKRAWSFRVTNLKILIWYLLSQNRWFNHRVNDLNKNQWSRIRFCNLK